MPHTICKAMDTIHETCAQNEQTSCLYKCTYCHHTEDACPVYIYNSMYR